MKSRNQGKKSVLDPYGATDEAEFFAVAVEVFFERPDKLKRQMPQIYKDLSDYFNLDPAEWNGADDAI